MENKDNLPVGSIIKVNGKHYRKTVGTHACEGCALKRNSNDCLEAPSCIKPNRKDYIFKEYNNSKLNNSQITSIVIIVLLIFISIVILIFKIHNPW